MIHPLFTVHMLRPSYVFANVLNLTSDPNPTTKNAKQEETRQNLTQHTNELQLYWNTKQSPSVKELLRRPFLLAY